MMDPNDRDSRSVALFSRRLFLQRSAIAAPAIGALAAACGPAAAPAPAPAPQSSSGSAPAPAKAAWEQQWDDLVVAGKKDGRLQLSWTASTGGSYKPIVEDFEKAFPGISVELVSENSGSLLVPKVLQEHKAGVYSYDFVFTSIRFAQSMEDNGALQPYRSQIFRPDVLDDGVWDEGYEFGWIDKTKQYGYGFGMNVPLQWWMNTDQVKPGEIKSIYDLLDPKWKGKIIFSDPRSGFTATQATALRLNLGEDILRKLFVEQQPAYHRDNRLLTEAMVKGQYAIGTGILVPVLEEFKAQGLGKNLKQFDIPEAASKNMSHQMFMLKGAPNPNAAKLFSNWLLSKEGQTSFAKATHENSRRKDVPDGDPEQKPKPGQKVLWLSGNIQLHDESSKTGDILVKMIGGQ